MLCDGAEVLDGSMMVRRPGPADIDDVNISPLSHSTQQYAKSYKSSDTCVLTSVFHVGLDNDFVW